MDTLAIYAPMIYTSPCVIFLMRADTSRAKASGRGWALEIERVEMASSREANAIWSPKNSKFPGPNLLSLAQVMYEGDGGAVR